MAARSDRPRTQPVVPAGEIPATDTVVGSVLEAMPPGVVLVGGQALAFWMLRFDLALSLPQQAFVTSDIDVLGKVKDAESLHAALGGRLIKPAPEERTALVARLMLPVRGEAGQAYKVEIIHQLYDVGGQRRSTQFTARADRRALTVRLGAGFSVRVLHPLDVLTSRINNAAGLLRQKGEHVITQAAWAVDVMREALLRLAADGESREGGRVGVMIREVYGLAHSSAGRTVRRQHGIEVMDAVPEKRLVILLPSLRKQFDAVHARMGEKW